MQGLTLILFGLTILAVTTNIIDNTFSPLVGVALMTPAIALGYGASILVHMWINAHRF